LSLSYLVSNILQIHRYVYKLTIPISFDPSYILSQIEATIQSYHRIITDL